MQGLHCYPGFPPVTMNRGYSLLWGVAFSFVGAPLVGEHRLKAPGLQYLWLPASRSWAHLWVVVHGLCCSEASGVFPDQGSNLCLLQWKYRLLTTRPSGKFFLKTKLSKFYSPSTPLSSPCLRLCPLQHSQSGVGLSGLLSCTLLGI